jgi:hypothetical protein
MSIFPWIFAHAWLHSRPRRCTRCGVPVSQHAIRCDSCGAKPDLPQSWGIILLGICVMAGAGMGFALSDWLGPEEYHIAGIGLGFVVGIIAYVVAYQLYQKKSAVWLFSIYGLACAVLILAIVLACREPAALHRGQLTDSKLKALIENGQLHTRPAAKARDGGKAASDELIATIILKGEPVTDAGLKELAALPGLETLRLDQTAVTDEGLKAVGTLQGLRELDLQSTAVTDAGLKELAGLKGLQILVLYDTKVTDAGLKHLRALRSLKELYLPGRGVTDEGVKELTALGGLKALSLSGTAVTDVGLNELAAFHELQSLNLSLTQVTDEGLKPLAALQGLEYLSLYHTGVTDAGLEELAALKALKQLDLVGTKVTEEGATKLRKALPDCRVTRTIEEELSLKNH